MLRVVFMGTPEFSVPTLAEIVAAGHEVTAVYSQPPRPAGRGMDERKSPVHVFAIESGIPVLTPKSLRNAPEQEAFAAHRPDVAVVVAYGLILPQAVLDAPKHGCLNLHASSLPRWRGAAPIQRAIMAGDTETAAMVMRMDAGLDTGPVCLAEQVPIGSNMTAGMLHDQLMVQGAGLVVRALAALQRGSLHCTQQSVEGATYASKIEKAEAKIDFSRSAAEVHNHIRGLSPFPGAWFEVDRSGKRERLKVLLSEVVEADAKAAAVPGQVLDDNLAIACGKGAVRLSSLQRAGKRPMGTADLLRGFPLERGIIFT